MIMENMYCFKPFVCDFMTRIIIIVTVACTSLFSDLPYQTYLTLNNFQKICIGDNPNPSRSGLGSSCHEETGRDRTKARSDSLGRGGRSDCCHVPLSP